MRQSRRFSVGRCLAHAVLLSGAGLTLFPFLWMWRASTKASDEIFGTVANPVPMLEAMADNYRQALFETPLLRFMANGLLVTGSILLFQIVTSLACAYALARYEFRGRATLFAMVLIVLALPVQAPALPLYLALAKIGLLDSYAAMILPYMTSAFAIFLFRQFIKSFPDDIIAAAKLDGMTEVDIVLRLILPSMGPSIAAFAVFSVTGHWNDLYWPMIVIRSIDLAPPTLGILFFRSQEGGDSFGPLMASATLVTAPLILMFLAAQGRFVQGVTMTGVK